MLWVWDWASGATDFVAKFWRGTFAAGEKDARLFGVDRGRSFGNLGCGTPDFPEWVYSSFYEANGKCLGDCASHYSDLLARLYFPTFQRVFNLLFSGGDALKNIVHRVAFARTHCERTFDYFLAVHIRRRGTLVGHSFGGSTRHNLCNLSLET